jgi:hypothetical protein
MAFAFLFRNFIIFAIFGAIIAGLIYTPGAHQEVRYDI